MPRKTPQRRADTPQAPPRPAEAVDAGWTRSWRGGLVLLAGWLLPQLVLIGPALVGHTVLAPAELLAMTGYYLPRTAEYQHVVPRDFVLGDLITISPAAREFCNREFRAGRLPLWQPANYAGAPFATWPKYSPFELPYYLLPRPITLAWMHLIQVIFYGLGTWLFLRRRLGLSYWPAAIGSWCAPLTGFFTLWQGYPVTGPVCWLPWLLYLIGGVVVSPWGWSSLALAIVTALLLFCGQADVAGLVLLTSGIYAVWRLATAWFANRQARPIWSAACALTMAWLLGFLLAMPYLLPMFEFTGKGERMQARAAGKEERPPRGWQALAAVALPEIYGTSKRGSQRLLDGPLLESSSCAYVGLLAALWLAPLAWCDPRRRGEVIFWTALACVSLGWVLNLPGIVQVQRLPPLNMLSFNRWTFATATALLVLAAVGMEQLFSGAVRFRRGFWLPILFTIGLGGWCLLSAVSLPEALRARIEPVRLASVQRWLAWYYAAGAFLSALALLGWFATYAEKGRTPWLKIAVAFALVAELTWFAHRQNRQASYDLYFPRVAALEQLAALPPGRTWGLRCLPPNLNQSHGLSDIRGYDAVDCAEFIRLLEPASDPAYQSSPYAKTQFAVPKIDVIDGRPTLSPIANLLNVRYLILRSPPPSNRQVVVHQDDYWIVENPAALPRASVPRSVRRVADPPAALQQMSRPDFDPAAVALVTDSLDLPASIAGSVTLTRETPSQLELEATMTTDGLVLISDLWDSGWQATVDGQPGPLYKVDFALRGVRVPAGHHTILLSYQPSSVRLGFQLAGVGIVCVLAWAGYLGSRRTRVE